MQCCCWIVPGYLIGGENRKSEKARYIIFLMKVVATDFISIELGKVLTLLWQHQDDY